MSAIDERYDQLHLAAGQNLDWRLLVLYGLLYAQGSVQRSHGNSPPDGISYPFPRMSAQRREGTNGPRFR